MQFPSDLTPSWDTTFIDSWPNDHLEVLVLENLRYELGYYTEEAFLTQRPGWTLADWERMFPAAIIGRYGALLHRRPEPRVSTESRATFFTGTDTFEGLVSGRTGYTETKLRAQEEHRTP